MDRIRVSLLNLQELEVVIRVMGILTNIPDQSNEPVNPCHR